MQAVAVNVRWLVVVVYVLFLASGCEQSSNPTEINQPSGATSNVESREAPRAEGIFPELDVRGADFRTDQESQDSGTTIFTDPATLFDDYATRYLVRPGTRKRLARLEVMRFEPGGDEGFSLDQWARTFAADAGARPPHRISLGGLRVPRNYGELMVKGKPRGLYFVWWRYDDYLFLGTAPNWQVGRPLIDQLIRQTRPVVERLS